MWCHTNLWCKLGLPWHSFGWVWPIWVDRTQHPRPSQRQCWPAPQHSWTRVQVEVIIFITGSPWKADTVGLGQGPNFKAGTACKTDFVKIRLTPETPITLEREWGGRGVMINYTSLSNFSITWKNMPCSFFPQWKQSVPGGNVVSWTTWPWRAFSAGFTASIAVWKVKIIQ